MFTWWPCPNLCCVKNLAGRRAAALFNVFKIQCMKKVVDSYWEVENDIGIVNRSLPLDLKRYASLTLRLSVSLSDRTVRYIHITTLYREEKKTKLAKLNNTFV